MKKCKHRYTAISLLFLIGMLVTGCDGFLDVELDNQIKLEEVFNKRSTTEQYLAQVYGFVPQTYNWHENAVGANIPMSDEALFSWMSGLGYHSFLNGTWSVTTTSYAIWKNMYQAINQATVFMNHVDECVELTQKEKDIMKAEARFLRAYFYTLLINRYGPVYVWGDQDSDSSIHVEDVDRHPLETNVQFVIEEYDKAAEVLPLQITDVSWYGRVTKGAVLAAKTRFLLYMASPLFNGCSLYQGMQNKDGELLFPQSPDPEKWQKAADAAKAVIDLGIYDLVRNTTETDPFKRAIRSYMGVTLEKWNKEVIWGQWQTDGMFVVVRCNPPKFCKTGYGGYCPSIRLVDTYPMAASGRFPVTGYNADGSPVIDPKSGYVEDGFRDSYKHPLDTFLLVKAHNSCVGRDARFYASVLANGFPWLNPAMRKDAVTFFDGGTSSYSGSGDCVKVGYSWRRMTDPTLNTDQGNWGQLVAPIFRLGEIYLNYAEACNEKPNRDEAEALKYINLVRERSGLNKLEEAYPEVKGNKNLLRELIQKERMVELAFETLRLPDLCRWMTAKDILNGKVWTRNVAAKNYEDSWHRTTSIWASGDRVFADKNYLFPIPQEQLNEMQNLTQNYGW